MMTTNKHIGLYIHIPFCKRKCNYCDFYSLGCPDGGKIHDYVSIICAQMQREAPLYAGYEIDSIFIGGGTPSLIENEDFQRLANTIKKSFTITQGAEFSIEANPCTLNADKLRAYKECGVNRLSIGMQSANDDELHALGRLHTRKEFENAFLLARECGFDNINIDVMYALPEQSYDSLLKTIDYVCELSPEHISAYCLKIEDGTPFSKMELTLPDEDTQYEMYLGLCRRLSEHGYEQYEISNFAKKGARCVHNLKYWKQLEYIGYGPAAHSFFDGTRYFYADDIDAYCKAISCGGAPDKIAEGTTKMSEGEKADEYVMLAMRLCDGVSFDEFKAKFGVDFDSVYNTEKYEKSGHIMRDNEKVRFSSAGFFVSSFILSDILEHI